MDARRYLFATSRHPLTQALSLVLAIAFVAVAVMMGALLIAVLLALGAIAAVFIAVRIWWARRKSGHMARNSSAPRVIEGDYTVVRESDADRGARPGAARTRDGTTS
jgi:uncharacterized iron-regulated membrane protein